MTIDPGPAYTPYQEPEHEGLFRRILGKVATSMAGDQTWKVTKDADGNVTAAPVQSTEGEKWGRIAATLLGGLAKGLPESFGPGGAARAASAGIQTGLQAGQKNFQDADTQVTAEQRQQEAAANNALLHQRHYMGMLTSQQLKGQIAEADAKILGDYDTAISGTPNARDFGTITGYNDLKRIHDSNPEFFKSHTNLQLKSLPVRAKDGSFELHAVATDPGWDLQRVGKGQYRLKLNVDPKTGEPSLEREDVAEGSDTNGKLALFNTAEVAKYIDSHNKWTDSQTRKQVASDRAEDAKQRADDREQARLDRKENQEANRDLRREIANANRSVTPQAASNWGELLADPTSGVTLAQVPIAQRQSVIDQMKTSGQKMAHPLTAKELERSDLAKNTVSNIERMQQILTARPDMFGPAGYGKTKLAQFIKGGDPDALAYQTAASLANLPAVGIHGVRGKYALEDIAKLDSNLYLNPEAMKAVLGEIHRSASEFARTGGRDIKTNADGAQPAGNTSQAARVPSPASIAGDPSWTTDGKGNFMHYNGKEWVKATPPAR
jgi:hypothetical protein